MFTAADHRFMARALRLAARGRATARPNPAVGCVFVDDGRIVGEGWHARAGGPHAEIAAIQNAGGDVRGTTAYVSLEPCAHHGKTPPCAQALIDAGVAAVVAAMRDPFAQVSGRGIAALEAAGIEVRVGLLEAEARELNRGYVSRIERGRPFATLKLAASLDGATAMASGESQWITGEAARRDVQRLRARSGAILTGVGTVLADDPSLTVRVEAAGGPPPLRAVVDSRLRTPAGAKVLSPDTETLLYCVDDERRAALEAAGAEVVALGASEERVDTRSVLADLAARGVNDLLVECGPTLAGRMVAARLIDELVIYQAPHIMGSDTRRLFATPDWRALGDRLELEIRDVRRVGDDLRITAVPAGQSNEVV